ERNLNVSFLVKSFLKKEKENQERMSMNIKSKATKVWSFVCFRGSLFGSETCVTPYLTVKNPDNTLISVKQRCDAVYFVFPSRKLYVVLSVLFCLLICGLVLFFLFPRSIVVQDGGIKMVRVWFDKPNEVVTISAMSIKNSNFYGISVSNLLSQVQYINTVIGTIQMTNVTLIPPLSEKMVCDFQMLYNFCTLTTVKVHNIVVFMRTSLTFSYIGHVSQSSLETYQYIDCGANSTVPRDPLIN
uniref:Transmembrane protein 106 C-terminal domain-containing protein n=1 Tax=Leptobrachium leishanense TaxID=445787 RepID=A0A8C5WL88_9ANUR